LWKSVLTLHIVCEDFRLDEMLHYYKYVTISVDFVEGTVKDINVHFKQCDKENSPKMDWLTKKRLEKESESVTTLVTKDSGSSKFNKIKLISQECSLFNSSKHNLFLL
jgi:hypothetical protein